MCSICNEFFLLSLYFLQMKKLIAATIITIILLVTITLTATAAENKSQVKIEAKTSNNKQENKNWKGFELKGVVSNLTANSFSVNNTSVNINLAVTNKVHINGTLEENAFVKVEGKVVDGKYFAKEIKVEDRNGGDKNEKEEKNINPISPTTSPTISASPSPDINESAKKADNKVDIKISGSLESVIDALENLLNILKAQL